MNKEYLYEQYYVKRRTLSDISKEFGCCRQTIKNKLISFGFTENIINNQNYDFDRNNSYFHCVDNEYKAYFLGLLISDGNITDDNRVRLSLKDDDYDILEEFKYQLNSSCKIVRESRRNKTQLSLV